jgi:hypothetical protein
VIRRRHLTAAAAATAVAVLLAGCGGGGGADDAQGDLPPADAGIPVASGVGPGDSALQAIAALGVPGAVDGSGAAQTLTGYDAFGTPHDPFEQQVDDTASSGSGTTDAPAIPPDTPINGDPLVAVPTPTPPATTPEPPVDAPVQNPLALEADFDISGEPVVAREGDAIPPDTQQFVVQSMTPTSVTLELSGGLLPDGTDTVVLDEGESITLYNATARRAYKIKLVDVRRV